MSIGKRIQARRTKLGWSREELAERLGVKRMTVWRIETGESEVRIGKLRKLARVLKTSVSELVA